MSRVVVVGGGVSGLAAAYRISSQLPEADVIVLEASAAPGGKLRSARIAGIEVDVGAEAVLVRRPEAVDLITAVGLAGDLIEPSTTAANVRAGGKAHPLPTRTMLGIPADAETVRASGVLSAGGLDRILTEPGDTEMQPLVEDVAVGALVRSRLGNEVADRLVEPLLGGVYAGRADELSLQATMPALAAHLAAAGGSLVRAARAVTDTGAHDRGAGAVFASLRGGLGRLPTALAASGGFEVRTSTTVRAVRRTARGFEVLCGPAPEQQAIRADAVVLATPAVKTALLLREVAPAASAGLNSIDSASVAIVTLAFGDVHTPAGSGLLIALQEGFTTKAVTLTSQKWPIDTGGVTVLRASLGRAGDAQALQRDDAELIALVRHELRTLIGVAAEPIDATVTRWGGGLPQYAVGHVGLVERIRTAVAAVPALAVCGASYDGVGVPACIASAYLAADRVVAALLARGQCQS